VSDELSASAPALRQPAWRVQPQVRRRAPDANDERPDHDPRAHHCEDRVTHPPTAPTRPRGPVARAAACASRSTSAMRVQPLDYTGQVPKARSWPPHPARRALDHQNQFDARTFTFAAGEQDVLRLHVAMDQAARALVPSLFATDHARRCCGESRYPRSAPCRHEGVTVLDPHPSGDDYFRQLRPSAAMR
jgi:hypothetical protein